MDLSSRPIFGQLIVGPPGSGKTTYCKAISRFMEDGLGRRPIIINIDPANENLPFKPDICISDLVKVEEVMELLKLGPNGGLMYCMEFLEKNWKWLKEQITDACRQALAKNQDPYVLFDCPGQVELYTHQQSFRNIVINLTSRAKPSGSNQGEPIKPLMKVDTKEQGATTSNQDAQNDDSVLDLRLCAVNLVDSQYVSDGPRYISVLLNSLSTMINLELPHINILSKVDLIEKLGKTQFGLDYYCEVLDLKYISGDMSNDPFMHKYKKLTESIADVIEGYSLVSFIPMDVNKPKSLLKVQRAIDKANGYFIDHPSSQDEAAHRKLYNEYVAANFEYAKYEELLEQLASDPSS